MRDIDSGFFHDSYRQRMNGLGMGASAVNSPPVCSPACVRSLRPFDFGMNYQVQTNKIVSLDDELSG